MNYPNKLQPNRVEKYQINEHEFDIPVVDLTLKKWEGETIANTFGGKPLVEYKEKPMFAELAIQKIAEEDKEWQSRWVETYACKATGPYYFTDWSNAALNQQSVTPLENPKIEKILNEIAILNSNSYSGCWDALVWNNDFPIFVELKRNGKDAVRSTQLKWLKAALEYGLTLDNFMIVQWEFE